MKFVGTEKRVRIIHGKRAVRIRAIEVAVLPYYLFKRLGLGKQIPRQDTIPEHSCHLTPYKGSLS